jgi:hypothetical protein
MVIGKVVLTLPLPPLLEERGVLCLRRRVLSLPPTLLPMELRVVRNRFEGFNKNLQCFLLFIFIYS